jgi:hypothetical protein
VIILNKPHTINSTQIPDKTIPVSNSDTVLSSEESASVRIYATYSANRSIIDVDEVRNYDQIRYKLLHTQRESLRKYASKKHRIYECHHSFVPNANPELDYNTGTKRSSIHNVKKCKNQYCAVCSVRDGYESRQRLARIIAEGYKQDLVPVLLTLNLQHGLQHSCKDNVEAYKRAWKKFTEHNTYKKKIRDAYGVYGYYWQIDETFSPINGSHVHGHVVLFIEKDKFDPKDWANDEDEDSLWTLIADHWQSQVHKVGRDCIKKYAVDIQHGDQYIGEYVAKHGTAPKNSKWDITAEATLKTFKRGDHSPEEQHYTVLELLMLAHVGDEWASRMYGEYVDAMKGKKRANLSDNIKKLEDSIVDDDPPAVESEEAPEAEDTPEQIPSFEITRPAWRYARKTVNKRGLWLKLHQENRLDELVYDVAECHIKGVFTELVKLTNSKPCDGWHKVESGSYNRDCLLEVGRVFVVKGKIKEVILSQPLDSGVYGRWLDSVADESDSLEVVSEGASCQLSYLIE